MRFRRTATFPTAGAPGRSPWRSASRYRDEGFVQYVQAPEGNPTASPTVFPVPAPDAGCTTVIPPRVPPAGIRGVPCADATNSVEIQFPRCRSASATSKSKRPSRRCAFRSLRTRGSPSAWISPRLPLGGLLRLGPSRLVEGRLRVGDHRQRPVPQHRVAGRACRHARRAL